MATILPDRRAAICSASEPGALTEIGHARLSARALGAEDLPAIERHLLRLGPLDRHARFLTYATDALIAAHARGLDPSTAVLVGALDSSGRMLALAEAHPTDAPRTVEIAVSVDAGFRRRGLGRRLVARALALAFARGAQSAEFVFALDNYALARLVQAFGGQMKTPGHACIRPPDIASARRPNARHSTNWTR